MTGRHRVGWHFNLCQASACRRGVGGVPMVCWVHLTHRDCQPNQHQLCMALAHGQLLHLWPLACKAMCCQYSNSFERTACSRTSLTDVGEAQPLEARVVRLCCSHSPSRKVGVTLPGGVSVDVRSVCRTQMQTEHAQQHLVLPRGLYALEKQKHV